MEGLLAIAGVIVGAVLVMLGDVLRERRARRIARFEAAQRAAERIMDVLVLMDKARLSVWEREPRGRDDDSDRAAAFATFRDALPTLVATIRLAHMVPLTAEAIERLRDVDATLGHLPQKEATFHELSEERQKLNDAFDAFLSAVRRMAP